MMASPIESLRPQLSTLRDQFSSASSRWPNLEGLLLQWPESSIEPNDDFLPRYLGHDRLAMPFVKQPDGTYICTSQLIGMEITDGPGKRFKDNYVSRLRYCRPFGNFSDRAPTQAELEDHSECAKRYKTLADAAGELLQQFGLQVGVSPGALGRSLRYFSWTLAMFDAASSSPRQLESNYQLFEIQDLFLCSAMTIDHWIEFPKAIRATVAKDHSITPALSEPVTPKRKADPSRWGLGVDEQGKWQVFHRSGKNQSWRHRGVVEIPNNGNQSKILELLANGNGRVDKQSLLKEFAQPGKTGFETMKSRVTPTLSKLRRSIKDTLKRMGRFDEVDDPIPTSDDSWVSKLVVGYAIRPDTLSIKSGDKFIGTQKLTLMTREDISSIE